ncbi:MAG: hypothetical protein IT559_06055, partial [Alphaproteobacteria bacterium]|nr:hypothetical protein [Alphaproteobacteria bacterium]
ALNVITGDAHITLSRPEYQKDDPKATSNTIIMTKPDGTVQDLTLLPEKDGVLRLQIQADQPGIYSFETADGESRFAVIGDLNPLEYRDILSTDKILRPLSAQTGGGLWRLSQTTPALRTVSANARAAGSNWAGLRDNHSYIVTGAHEKPFLPFWVSATLLLGLALISWWREGRS